MRPLLILLLVIAHTINGQTNRRDYISISIDSVKKIRIVDHQNLNYIWLYGRTYEITKSDDAFIFTRTDQYTKPLIFGAPSLEARDTINALPNTLQNLLLPIQLADSHHFMIAILGVRSELMNYSFP